MENLGWGGEGVGLNKEEGSWVGLSRVFGISAFSRWSPWFQGGTPSFNTDPQWDPNGPVGPFTIC